MTAPGRILEGKHNSQKGCGTFLWPGTAPSPRLPFRSRAAATFFLWWAESQAILPSRGEAQRAAPLEPAPSNPALPHLWHRDCPEQRAMAAPVWGKLSTTKSLCVWITTTDLPACSHTASHFGQSLHMGGRTQTHCLQRGTAMHHGVTPLEGVTPSPHGLLCGPAAPSSSWAVPISSCWGSKAKAWAWVWVCGLQRWAVGRGGEWGAQSSSTRSCVIGRQQEGDGHLQGSAEILRSMPMATSTTQDYHCSRQDLEFNKKARN